RAIVDARRETPIVRTSQLAEIVSKAHPSWEPGKHPATRTFQAVRIQVSQEFEEIGTPLAGSVTALAPGGGLCVVSFNSLAGGMVKRFMEQRSQEDPVYAGLPDVPAHARPKLRRVGKPVHPSEEEVAVNPRSRSSVLRVAEKVAA